MGLGQGLLEVRTAKLELVKDGVLQPLAGTVHREEAVLKSGASSAVTLIIFNRKSACSMAGGLPDGFTFAVSSTGSVL